MSLIADRNFGPYFVGNLASNIGTWFQQVTAAVVVFDLTGSAFMVGLVGVSQFLPILVLSPWTGAAADRFDRRRLLLGSQVVAGAAVATLAVVTVVFGLDGFTGAGIVLGTGLVLGVANAVSAPTSQALVPALVPLRDLDQAVALNSVTFNLARAVGPALGAAVLVAWGPGIAFGFNALSYCALVVGLLLVTTRDIGPPQRGSIWVGLRHVRSDPPLALLLSGLVAVGFAADPLITLTPSLAHGLEDSLFTNADALVGLVISAFGLGAVIGTFVVTSANLRWGHARVATVGFGFIASGLAVLGLASTAPLALGGALLGGFGFLLGVTSLTTAIHVRVPEELRGRVMAIWAVAFLGSRPLAAVINGAMADLTSARVATVVVAVVVALAGLIFRRRSPTISTTPPQRT
jgi:MFS family permease